jgi:transcription elongation GreA/GreB family factor
MQVEIQKAVDAGKLTTKAGELVAQLAPGTFVNHKSWGFGQVARLDFLIHQITIDFKTKRGHSMQIQYAAESLSVVDAGHILARKWSQFDEVKAQAKDDIVGLSRNILESFGGKATQDQIQGVLVPDVMSEAEFKKWFELAKKSMKADGHFAIPTKKGLPFELRVGPISHADEYLAAFNNARQLKEQIKAVELIIKHLSEFSDGPASLQPVVVAINDGARKSAKLKPDETLTLLVTRDELVEKVPGLSFGSDAPSLSALLAEESKQLSVLLSKVPDSKIARAVSAIPAAFGDDWASRALGVVLRADKSRLAAETATLLARNGKADELRNALERAIGDHSISSAALCWLCEDRVGFFSDLLDQKVATAIIAALERDAHNEKKDRKLHDLLMNDQELLPELIAGASTEQLRDFMRKLLITTVFEDLNRRSLLGRIVRIYPELGSMITGQETQESDFLIVSWESLERKKAEYDELINKRIPENVKEISIARSYGDLRENFEFKAAKEMQRVLNRRRSEMERDLSIARGTDFATADSGQVGIGTIVTLKDAASGETSTYTILGAWDGQPEIGIVSYQSALARALLGHKPGEKLVVPTENGDRTVEVQSVARYRS